MGQTTGYGDEQEVSPGNVLNAGGNRGVDHQRIHQMADSISHWRRTWHLQDFSGGVNQRSCCTLSHTIDRLLAPMVSFSSQKRVTNCGMAPCRERAILSVTFWDCRCSEMRRTAIWTTNITGELVSGGIWRMSINEMSLFMPSLLPSLLPSCGNYPAEIAETKPWHRTLSPVSRCTAVPVPECWI